MIYADWQKMLTPDSLLVNQYEIKVPRERLTASVTIPEDFIGFNGHFPGSPLMPAFTQVILVQDLASLLLDHPVSLEKIVQAKFLAPILPEYKVDVELEIKADGELKAQISAKGETRSIFRMRLAKFEEL